MLAYMARTTVKISDQLDARLRHEAVRRGMTVSELTREAIEAHLGGPRVGSWPPGPVTAVVATSPSASRRSFAMRSAWEH
jgi:hypothetical protein